MGSCPDTDIDPIHSPFEVYSVEVVELFLIMRCIFFLPECKHEHGKPPWEKRGRDLLQHFFFSDLDVCHKFKMFFQDKNLSSQADS